MYSLLPYVLFNRVSLWKMISFGPCQREISMSKAPDTISGYDTEGCTVARSKSNIHPAIKFRQPLARWVTSFSGLETQYSAEHMCTLFKCQASESAIQVSRIFGQLAWWACAQNPQSSHSNELE